MELEEYCTGQAPMGATEDAPESVRAKGELLRDLKAKLEVKEAKKTENLALFNERLVGLFRRFPVATGQPTPPLVVSLQPSRTFKSSSVILKDAI